MNVMHFSSTNHFTQYLYHKMRKFSASAYLQKLLSSTFDLKTYFPNSTTIHQLSHSDCT